MVRWAVLQSDKVPSEINSAFTRMSSSGDARILLGGLLIRLGCQTRLAAPHSCKFDMPRVNSQERATRDQAHHRATYLVMETAELQTAPL